MLITSQHRGAGRRRARCCCRPICTRSSAAPSRRWRPLALRHDPLGDAVRRRRRFDDVPVLLQTSVGLCLNAAQAPQGVAIVVQVQQRGEGDRDAWRSSNGRHLAFPFRIGERRPHRGTPASDADHVRDELLQLLLTSPGERLFLPEFGGGVRKLVFEPASDALRGVVKARITNALSRWLGHRLTVELIEVDLGRAPPRCIEVTVKYRAGRQRRTRAACVPAHRQSRSRAMSAIDLPATTPTTAPTRSPTPTSNGLRLALVSLPRGPEPDHADLELRFFNGLHVAAILAEITRRSGARRPDLPRPRRHPHPGRQLPAARSG